MKAPRGSGSSRDETLAYTVSLRMRPTPVKLRMLKPEGGAAMYLLLDWKFAIAGLVGYLSHLVADNEIKMI